MKNRLYQIQGPFKKDETVSGDPNALANEYVVALGVQIPKSPRFISSVLGGNVESFPSAQLTLIADGKDPVNLLVANNDALQFDNLLFHSLKLKVLQDLPSNAIFDVVYAKED